MSVLDTHNLPEPLREPAQRRCEALAQLDLPADVSDAAARVLVCSNFVAGWCARHPDEFAKLVADGFLTASFADISCDLALEQCDGMASAMQRLRQWRNQWMLRIAWRDLAGWADLDETLAELSWLADTCIGAALDWLLTQADDQTPVPVVMAMGKLGGRELNFSSDIDLIFSYRAGNSDEQMQPLLRRLLQRLIKLLGEVTQDGFVFRVDTRLRPFGESGPLVMSVGAMENYYQVHGREWERYAWIKARPVAGDIAGGDKLLKRLQPFVYRRYLDYNAFESIREMKSLIAQQVARRNQQGNIKLGRGGIREVEFIAQGFQLIRGGHEPALRDNRVLPVLGELARAGHLPAHVTRSLENAYRFLRRVENRLQMADDRQTHDLPATEQDRQALALAMDLPDWQALCADLESHRRAVDEHFQQVFAAPQIADQDGRNAQALLAVWHAGAQATAALEALSPYNLSDRDAAWKRLLALREGRMYRALGERGRRRLQQLLPMLLQVVAQRDAADAALIRVLDVVEQIIGRTTYVALLVENPAALSRLVDLCGASPWITQQIESQPELLDALLDSRLLFAPPDKAQLRAELRDTLAGVSDDDLESRMDLLRRFQQRAVLRVAVADVTQSMPLMVVSDRLTDIAELVLAAALDMAWAQMTARFGRPVLADTGKCAQFAVIAYGKLGGIELGYGSDLDLVFLYDGLAEQVTDGKRSLSHQAFFLRLAQRLIHILSTRTRAGRAYEVDMRLRPSGQSGLLVSHIDAYGAYQRDAAWTWEHQALTRARFVAGDATLGKSFTRLRSEVLGRQRDNAQLRGQVTAMRDKMRASLDCSKAGQLDVKQMPGGLIDIEFMAQYAVLRHAHACPELLLFTDNIRVLETLESGGIVDYDTTKTLVSVYRAYRQQIHAQALQECRAMITADKFSDERAAVQAVWRQWLSIEGSRK